MLFGPPKPPSLDELRRNTPAIEPVAAGVDRPFWSVMIPTYNRTEFLRKAIESVLVQDPGPDHMQIEVVDNCSTSGDIEKLVREIGKDRVSFFRQATNLGMVANFNTCLNRARGHWVHILSDDDAVLPGFYTAYRSAIEQSPGVVMATGQVKIVDENDSSQGVYPSFVVNEGPIVEDFLLRQATEQVCQVVGVVVNRQAYEQAGGFCSSFGFVIDWDMWFRIGQIGAVAAVHQPYGMFRVHSESAGSRIKITGTNIQEIYFLIEVNLARLNGCSGTIDRKHLYSQLAQNAGLAAWQYDEKGNYEGRLNQARWAWLLEPNPRRFSMLAKSWLKVKLYGRRRALQ